jgi:hypothetical protein
MVLAVSRVQEDSEDVLAVSSMILLTKGAYGSQENEQRRGDGSHEGCRGELIEVMKKGKREPTRARKLMNM